MSKPIFKNNVRISCFFLALLSLVFVTIDAANGTNTDTTKKNTKPISPNVFNENHSDLIESKLKQEATLRFPLYQLPVTKTEWQTYRANLKKEIIKKTGALVNQKLPLNLRETGSLKMKGYTIKNIAFQTRPGIYATANLYIPDGNAPLPAQAGTVGNDKAGHGKFPGVIVMMGHSLDGRFYDKYQSVGTTLALNGYVSLCIDPWGSGERTTIHGVFEDHGDDNNLGAALMDVGQPLMGMLISDNIRGVDLLCSLPYIDPQNIGATGSSGGGNQTMWLTAMDERIKAAVPVVSAGTFESYIMGSPCICEVLIDGLTFTEEAAVLGLIAPRALKLCNHSKDANAAFNPREMLRSYRNAKPVFEMLDAKNNIAYDTFDLTHGYWPEDRQAMLGWFNLHLKGIGNAAPVKEVPFNTLPTEQLMVYAKGKRDKEVLSTQEFCKQRGNELRAALLKKNSFNAKDKRNELKNILRVNEESTLKNIHKYSKINGWDRFALETSDDKLIPVLLHTPSKNSKEFIIVSSPDGKESVSQDLIERLIKSGSGIAIVDLSGTGETSSPSFHSNDSMGRLRTLSKSYLWLGKTVMGEWVKELNIVTQFIKSTYKSSLVGVYGIKEAGLAGLNLAAVEGNIENVTLQYAPVSYLFDNRESIEYFSTGIHLPGFLNWGDVSLAAALSGKKVTFINPVTMSGREVTGVRLKAFESEFEKIRRACREGGKTVFN